MVVDICTASAVSATLILKNIWGPCPDINDPKAGDIPNGDAVALVPSAREEPTLSKPPSEACFFFFPMIRDGRRWILDSSVLFCWTVLVGPISPVAAEFYERDLLCGTEASKTA